MRAPIRQPDVTGGRGCTNTVTFNVKCRKKSRLYRAARYIRLDRGDIYVALLVRVDFRGAERRRRRRHDTRDPRLFFSFPGASADRIASRPLLAD